MQLGRAARAELPVVVAESAAPSSRRAPTASYSASSGFRAKRLRWNSGAIARDEIGSDPGRCKPHSADTTMLVKNRPPPARRFSERLANLRRRRTDMRRRRLWCPDSSRLALRARGAACYRTAAVRSLRACQTRFKGEASRRPGGHTAPKPRRSIRGLRPNHGAGNDFAEWPRFDAISVPLAVAGTSNGGGALSNRSGTCYTWRGRPISPVAVQPNAKWSDSMCNKGKGERGEMEKAD